jgi:hypothetical protein
VFPGLVLPDLRNEYSIKELNVQNGFIEVRYVSHDIPSVQAGKF